MTKEECEIETSKAIMEMRSRIAGLEEEKAELEKENAELEEEKAELELRESKRLEKLVDNAIEEMNAPKNPQQELGL